MLKGDEKCSVLAGELNGEETVHVDGTSILSTNIKEDRTVIPSPVVVKHEVALVVGVVFEDMCEVVDLGDVELAGDVVGKGSPDQQRKIY